MDSHPIVDPTKLKLDGSNADVTIDIQGQTFKAGAGFFGDFGGSASVSADLIAYSETSTATILIENDDGSAFAALRIKSGNSEWAWVSNVNGTFELEHDGTAFVIIDTNGNWEFFGRNITAGDGTFSEMKVLQLSGPSGVYADGNDTLTSIAPSSGTLGHWDRTGTVLSPANAGDDIETTGDVSADNYILAITDSDSGQIIQDSERLLHTQKPSDQTPNRHNIFLGYQSGNHTMTNVSQAFHGGGNVGVGAFTLDALTTGYYNLAIGENSLTAITSGNSNSVIGYIAGFNLTSGASNMLLGREAGFPFTGADQNVVIGAFAASTAGANIDRCIIFGYLAGRDEDQSDRLIIDNRDRGDAATTRTEAIVYGIMAATPAGQTLTVNANLVASESILTPGDVSATVLFLNETTTPTPVADDGAIYTKANNELFFQDGSGVEHLLHGDAFSNLWFHDVVADTISIATSNTFVPITSFDNIGEEDDLGNVVGSVSTDDFTIGTNGGGNYKATFHLSATSSGAASQFVIVIGQVLGSALSITAATNATPIVCTVVGHGIRKGDMVTIANATGNTAANGDWFLKPLTSDTFTLLDLQGNNSVGNGAYTGSGTVDIIYHGNLIAHKDLSQTDIKTAGANADLSLVATDKVRLYVANIGATRDLDILIVNIEVKRIGD